MTNKTIGIASLVATLLVVGAVALAQSSSKPTAPATTAPKQQKLVKVCELDSVEANQQFQGNVQAMQVQRQQVLEAKAAYDAETNASKKKDLKTKLDDLLAKLNDNNQKMIKAYGFSLDRNYTLAVEKASVYMLVSDEEAAKIEKDQAAAAAKKK